MFEFLNYLLGSILISFSIMSLIDYINYIFGKFSQNARVTLFTLAVFTLTLLWVFLNIKSQ